VTASGQRNGRKSKIRVRKIGRDLAIQITRTQAPMQQPAAQLLGGRNEGIWADPTWISPLARCEKFVAFLSQIAQILPVLSAQPVRKCCAVYILRSDLFYGMEASISCKPHCSLIVPRPLPCEPLPKASVAGRFRLLERTRISCARANSCSRSSSMPARSRGKVADPRVTKVLERLPLNRYDLVEGCRTHGRTNKS
jgi:hypothetical protein